MEELRAPHNELAERAVIGTLLAGVTDPDEINPPLRAEDFYLAQHQAVYAAMLALHEAHKKVDVVTVAGELMRRGTVELAGGNSTLFGYVQDASVRNLPAHAAEIRDNSALRSLVAIAGEVSARASTESDPAALVQFAEEAIYAIGSRRDRGEPVPAGSLLRDAFARVEAACRTQNPVTGLPTGFSDLDRMLGGLQPSDLLVMGARPSMGKTSLALNIAANVALSGKKALFFSLEMSKSALADRLLSSEGRVDSWKMRAGQLKDTDWPLLTQAAGQLYEAGIYIDDTAAATVGEMRSKAHRVRSRYGLDLVVVDYLQLARPAGRHGSREQEVSSISRDLKALAKEMGLPVLALSQLSRALELRADKRPMLSDLRESGSLEQDADVVLFIYQASVYGIEGAVPGAAELLIAKQRNGPVGTVDLFFNKQTTRFDSAARVRPYSPGGTDYL